MIKALPQPGMIRVSRGRMRALCAMGIEVDYGKECVELVYEDGEGVTAKFAGGEEVKGLCVIGADGPQSVVRRSLLGVQGDGKPGGVTQYTALLKYTDAGTAEKVRSIDVLNALGYHPKDWCISKLVSTPFTPYTSCRRSWQFQ